METSNKTYWKKKHAKILTGDYIAFVSGNQYCCKDNHPDLDIAMVIARINIPWNYHFASSCKDEWENKPFDFMAVYIQDDFAMYDALINCDIPRVRIETKNANNKGSKNIVKWYFHMSFSELGVLYFGENFVKEVLNDLRTLLNGSPGHDYAHWCFSTYTSAMRVKPTRERHCVNHSHKKQKICTDNRIGHLINFIHSSR